MRKLKYGSLLCMVGLLSAGPLQAQDIEKEFEEFERQQLQAFDDFKNKADADFETFLRDTWEKFDAFAPVPVPVRPEPPQPVEFDKKKPALPPVSIKPGKIKTPETVPYVPVAVEVPVVAPRDIPVRRTAIPFYGASLEVAAGVAEDLTLTGNKEADVADAWKAICNSDYEQFLSDCLTLKKERRMNDWMYLLFTKQIGEQLYGATRTNEIVFLQMFLLNKSGYKVRMAKIDDRLKLMIATNSTVYAAPYLTMNGNRYYVFEPDPNGSMGIYTYRQDFADAKNLVALDIAEVPTLDMQEQDRTLKPTKGSLEVQAVVNKNLIDFYNDYPQCDVVLHYKARMSDELRNSIYPALRTAIEGKSQKDAANLLLNFVQTAFEYKTDGEQFGYEKPNFPDETFYYPYCDCEDRAMLYSTLVKDLLGLDTILLDYPNHIASAVRFTDDVTGDYVMLDDGSKYLICDPTYIGAPVGACMEQFKEVSPEIIR
ncbi:MAG: hypothetical protein Q4D56_09020 [Bacteroides sp.]|nr:hypothetical protein [Bacteroides sp.]